MLRFTEYFGFNPDGTIAIDYSLPLFSPVKKREAISTTSPAEEEILLKIRAYRDDATQVYFDLLQESTEEKTRLREECQSLTDYMETLFKVLRNNNIDIPSPPTHD